MRHLKSWIQKRAFVVLSFVAFVAFYHLHRANYFYTTLVIRWNTAAEVIDNDYVKNKENRFAILLGGPDRAWTCDLQIMSLLL